MASLSEKTISRIERIAGKLITKPLQKRLESLTLPQQVKMARKLMRRTGMIEYRSSFLKENGFPSDIKEKLEKGMTKEQVKEYYWSCKEFREFWLELQLTEDNFDYLLEEAK